MKYSIFYLIRGEAGKYNQKLVKKVGPMFGENYMVENPLPAHVVLKYPFETNNIKIVEDLLKEFVKDKKPSKISIEGFGNFRRFVAFMKTKFSPEARKIQKQLIKALEKIGIEPQEFDKKFKPHATIAYGNKKETFDGIWDYLKTLRKPRFNMVLDNIAIMKKGKPWKVYREFKIK